MNLFDSNWTNADTAVVIVSCVVLLLIILFIHWILSMRVVVPPNVVHIVQRSKGTVSYGVGNSAGNVYYKFPDWLPIWGVVIRELPVSNFDIDLKNYEAYDQDRLPFNVDVKAFFRITDTNQAAAKVKDVKELQGHLLGIVQGAVRSIMATSNLQDIMGERGIYGERFTTEVKESLIQWGVEAVKNLELMDIKDVEGSNVISNIMAKKKSEIEKESRIAVAQNQQIAKEKEIAAKQEVDIRTAEAERTVGQKQADVSKEIGISRQKAEQAIQEQTKISAEKQMEVERVKQVKKAEIDKDTAIVRAEAEKQQTIIQANAAKERTVIQANASKEQTVIAASASKEQTVISATASKEQTLLATDAEKFRIENTSAATLTASQNEATGIKAVGEARAEAEQLMQLAQVTAQTTLAREIGANKDYQEYLITIEQVKANRDVGVEQAKNLGRADIKIIANAGSTQEAIKSIGEVFTPKGGTLLGGALEALKNSPVGADLLGKLTSSPKTDTKTILNIDNFDE